MFTKRIVSTLIIAGVLATQTMIADAQSKRSGWSARATNGQTVQSVDVDASDPSESIEPLAVGPQEANGKARLVGTWLMRVPESPGAPAFNALQTYTGDGTMTETSDLLAQLNEGPAHGVWSGKKNDYLVTFELFAFDGNHQSVGRIRVRCSFHLTGNDELTAQAVVDFIEPDGNVIPNVGSTPFTGTRVKVLPPQ